MPPVVRLQHGCNYTITIPGSFNTSKCMHTLIDDCMILSLVTDADGDHIRCRWAEQSLNECGEICRLFPATLSESTVSLNMHE